MACSSKWLVLLAVAAVGGAQDTTTSYEALVARVRALEEAKPQGGVMQQQQRRSLQEEFPEEEISLDMNDPRTARRLGVARRYSWAFAHKRHEHMSQRAERNERRRRLQGDFYDPDEVCWTIDSSPRC